MNKRKPTISGLYARSHNTTHPISEHGIESLAQVKVLRPLIVQLQEQLDRACDEAYFAVLLAEGKSYDEARAIYAEHRQMINSTSWSTGTKRRIRS